MLSIIHSFEGELNDVLVEINKYKKEYHKIKILKIVPNKQLMDTLYTFIVEIKGSSNDQKEKILELYNTHYANS
jgi:hypothetical protein